MAAPSTRVGELNPFNALIMRQTEAAAAMLGIKLQSIAIRGADLDDTLADAAHGPRPGGLTVLEDGLTRSHCT